MALGESSRIPGFYKLKFNQKLTHISELTGISLERLNGAFQSLHMAQTGIDELVENCIGALSVPLGIAPNFKINGKDYLVPMAVEESSVIAAASKGARVTYESGGFASELLDNMMIGQVQFSIRDEKDADTVRDKIASYEESLLSDLNEVIPGMVHRGGGVRAIYARGPFTYQSHTFLVIQVDVSVQDAMGANVTNHVCERLGKLLNRMVPGQTNTCILSNLATKRLVHTTCRVHLSEIVPEHEWDDAIRRFELVQGFAEVDPFRAVTHNKGIMNGIDAVLLATGNDWRANEAGAFGYASLSGRIKPLSHWRAEKPYLFGELQLPIQLGIVGGVTRIHPTAKLSLDILGIEHGKELAELVGAVGLAQNFSALRALAFEGIMEGHMRLHKKNLKRHKTLAE